MYNHFSLLYCLIYGLLKRKRHDIVLYVTFDCNMKCLHCFVRGRKMAASVNLSLDDSNLIADKLPSSSHLVLTGGEPFLRGDLFELARIFIEKTSISSIQINTNGFYSERIADFSKIFLHAYRNIRLSFQISFYGSRDTHNRISGNNKAFDNMKESVERLSGLGSKIHLKLCCPIMSLNIQEYAYMVEFAQARRIPLSVSPLKRSPAQMAMSQDNELFISMDEYARFLNNLTSFAVEGKGAWPRSNRLRNQAYISLLRGKKYGRCLFPERTIIIMPDGGYKFCEFDVEVGNLLEDARIIEPCVSRTCSCLSYAYFCGKYLG